ncbi:Pimeloyl-ACP methyl ester carboxylesterase [Amycolatopsis marina]|uniref:Pimeloyl-ACP methyl ester carboxylesterase n=1 Tax=Amycolatopsis marina TaxID=490629 RepID=A0A1I1BSV2_9PSEU|nr:Pimeloyl-ACP methyl ester carboxylesterase [Amycolatopsis marina]
MSESVIDSAQTPQGTARTRPALTHVPMSTAPLPALDHQTEPWTGGYEQVGQASLHVRRTPGEGSETAVYVHGLGGSSTNWTDLAAQLAPTAAGVAVDLPGFGFSEPAKGFDFSLAAHAETLGDFVQGLDAGPVHLVGNSMGGAVALLLAARRPELVRTMTLISPAMPDLRPDPRRLSDPRMALAYLPLLGKRVRRQLARLTPRERAEQVIKLCFADPSAFPQRRLDELAEEHSARAELAWATPALAHSTLGIFRAWFARGKASLWSVAPTVDVPALVVWGTEDKVISVRRAVRTARSLPRGRLLVLPRTGHVAQMERPVSVARAVLGMWESVDANRW